MMPRGLASLLAGVVALVAAAALGWWLGQPEPVVETPAAEQRQADGSVVLERKPDAAAKPAHLVPDGSKVERVGSVTAKPRPKPANPCPPVTVDWSIVREPDGGRRVIASSRDGDILGGVDVPVETAAPQPEPKRWAAGLSWSPVDETTGVWVERDVPLFNTAARVGVEVMQARGATTGADARLRIGLAF